MFDDPNVVLHCEKIDKIYPGTKALDGVSFDVLKGKVNVLIGENGAGKSTLMKMIAGIEHPSAGTMYMDGKEIVLKDTNAAREHGIGIIHQELSLFPNLNIYQNIYMGHEQKKGFFLNDSAHSEGAKKVLQRLEHEMDPNTMVGDLRVGQQQMIEIGRNLLQNNLRILIMDEPTSSLSTAEVQVLFKIMRELTAAGISIVYISHRLEEIMEIGDHVTILRDGKYVADADVKDIQLSWIVKNMVGTDKSYRRIPRTIDLKKQPEILRVEHLSLPKRGGGFLVNDVSFDLKKGEILGIYGLLGAGRSEVFECLMGMHPESTGKIFLEGKEIKAGSIAEQIERGFAIVPEDRQAMGLVQSLDIEHNLSLSAIKDYRRGGFFVDEKKQAEKVEEEIKDIHIKVADKSLPILSLSGGNQQKVVIGKCILTGPKILLLDEPSRGIDIGAKTEVFDIIHKYAEEGLSIIVVSSELKEIMAIADRIMVLSNGLKTGELLGEEITEDNLVLASYAGHHTDNGKKESQK
ncbi:MAG: sugar ABC transporter ATP-binding protein [Lachnospiraceae bacterium]|nr:sugar ABC transporter ATP-binding protein [Lachnospiraceae bacterium]